MTALTAEEAFSRRAFFKLRHKINKFRKRTHILHANFEIHRQNPQQSRWILRAFTKLHATGNFLLQSFGIHGILSLQGRYPQ